MTFGRFRRIAPAALALLLPLGVAACSDKVDRGDLEKEVRKALDKQGITGDTQDCVVTATDKLSDDDLNKIAKDKEPSAEGQSAFIDAMTKCVAGVTVDSTGVSEDPTATTAG